MKKRRVALHVLTAVLGLSQICDGMADQEQPPAGTTTAPAKSQVALSAHIRIDRDKRQVILDAKVCLREGALELLVCKAKTKEYESVLVTEALGAHLHAALLALKLTPGLAAQWSGTDEEARFLPPRGPELAVTLRWKDDGGAERTAEAGTWIKHVGKKAALPSKWVFIGSRILPNNRYWADVDGDIISLSNFESAVIDVPFESSKDNTALEFAANTDAIPAVGTPVELVITPLPGAEKSPYAQAMLEIDALGRMALTGRAATADEVTAWAGKYISQHARGLVLIRADARALVDDVQKAISALRLGGVRSLDVERLRPQSPILPRSTDEAKQEMKTWEEKLKSPAEYIVDPRDEAKATLRQIESELRDLQARKDVLSDYAKALQTCLEHSTASGKPAGR